MNKINIDIAIAEFAYEIIREPLLYFSEADLQELLTEKLKELIPALKRKYFTKVSKGKNSNAKYKTTLIHREYAAKKGGRFDLVIFDKKDVAEINDVNLTKSGNYLNPQYAFELGTEKSIDTETHYKNDIEKLERVVKNGIGYLLHFQKDTTKSQTGTARRRDSEDKLSQDFKSVFVSNPCTKGIKVIAVLIRTGRKQKKMIGKCEIFNGNTWEKININHKKKIVNTVLYALK